VPEDGGAHRDLRVAAYVINEDAQLTARLPPPSVLALERTVTGRNLWFLGEGERANVDDSRLLATRQNECHCCCAGGRRS